MKHIATITDQEILGTSGLSAAKPRITARAIVKNSARQYALMHFGKFDLYGLPGGGVDEGDPLLHALKREIWEETGCTCDTIIPLGFIEENRAHADYTQISYYYIVHTNSLCLKPAFTDEEQKNHTSVHWCSLDEVCARIGDPQHTTAQRKYLQARDMAALAEYGKLLG